MFSYLIVCVMTQIHKYNYSITRQKRIKIDRSIDRQKILLFEMREEDVQEHITRVLRINAANVFKYEMRINIMMMLYIV